MTLMAEEEKPAPKLEKSDIRFKEIFSWEAPERPFKRRSKEFWTTLLSLVLLISLILFFAKEYFLIATIFALVFLFYILSTRPPQKITYKITNQGIFWGQTKYEWPVLHSFWVESDDGQAVLKVSTYLSFPRQLILPLGDQDEKALREVLENFLPYEQPEPTFIEKATNWLAKTFPLEGKPQEPPQGGK
jgi:hypothetical protein